MATRASEWGLLDRGTFKYTDYLGLPTASHAMSAPSRKLADETTRQWRERFVNERGAS